MNAPATTFCVCCCRESLQEVKESSAPRDVSELEAGVSSYQSFSRRLASNSSYTATLRADYNLTHRDVDKYRRRARKVIPPELRRRASRASRYGGNARERSTSVRSARRQSQTVTHDDTLTDIHDPSVGAGSAGGSGHLYRRRTDNIELSSTNSFRHIPAADYLP